MVMDQAYHGYKTMISLRLRASDDDGEDDDCLMPKALEVQEGSDVEDETVLPSTGDQYLRYVRREQARQKEIVTADVAQLKTRSDASNDPQSLRSEQSAGDGRRLSRRWQEATESEFSELRCRLSRWKAHNKDTLVRVARGLPAPGDEAAWSAICGSDPGKDGATGDHWRPPSLSTVAACSQRHVHALLERLLTGMEHHGLSIGRGSWTFALLAVLQKPLPAEVCSSLRQMTRLCRRRRDALPDADPIVPVATLIICLIGRYLGQADLADPC